MNKTGYGKAWIYRLINEGLFPQPVKIGVRAIAFIESEIDEWIVSAIERSRKMQPDYGVNDEYIKSSV